MTGSIATMIAIEILYDKHNIRLPGDYSLCLLMGSLCVRVRNITFLRSVFGAAVCFLGSTAQSQQRLGAGCCVGSMLRQKKAFREACLVPFSSLTWTPCFSGIFLMTLSPMSHANYCYIIPF